MTEIEVSIFILLWWNQINDEYTNAVKVNTQNCPKTVLVRAWLHAHISGSCDMIFLLGSTCNNHCDVTVRCVTLNCKHTLNQNKQTISIIFLGKQIKICQNVTIRYFENTDYLQGAKLPQSKHTSIFIMILIHVVFLTLSSKLTK